MAVGPKAKWIKNKFENIRIYFLILIGAILSHAFNQRRLVGR